MTDLIERLRAGFPAQSPRTLALEAASAIERLERWQAEAKQVLDDWEKVWRAAGRPGVLGGSKAQAMLELFRPDQLAAFVEMSARPHDEELPEPEPEPRVGFYSAPGECVLRLAAGWETPFYEFIIQLAEAHTYSDELAGRTDTPAQRLLAKVIR